MPQSQARTFRAVFRCCSAWKLPLPSEMLEVHEARQQSCTQAPYVCRGLRCSALRKFGSVKPCFLLPCGGAGAAGRSAPCQGRCSARFPEHQPAVLGSPCSRHCAEVGPILSWNIYVTLVTSSDEQLLWPSKFIVSTNDP